MKVKKFNESQIAPGVAIEYFIKSPEEFEKMRGQVISDFDRLINSYSKLTRQTSPKCWRLTGHQLTELRKMKVEFYKEVDKQLTMSDLEIEIVRDELLTPKQKELWNDMRKYNL
jgi:hypothetical protein